jgi:acyl carrier protein
MQEQFINSLKSALDISEHEVNLSDNFRDYAEWSSLAQLSLIAMLDDEYGVQIEMNDFNKIKTVEELYNAVIKLKE